VSTEGRDTVFPWGFGFKRPLAHLVLNREVTPRLAQATVSSELLIQLLLNHDALSKPETLSEQEPVDQLPETSNNAANTHHKSENNGPAFHAGCSRTRCDMAIVIDDGHLAHACDRNCSSASTVNFADNHPDKNHLRFLLPVRQNRKISATRRST
jgi:hypothetical protein